MNDLSVLARGFASPCACDLRCVLARGVAFPWDACFTVCAVPKRRESRGHHKLSAGADVSCIL